jgi:hypothetical protein
MWWVLSKKACHVSEALSLSPSSPKSTPAKTRQARHKHKIGCVRRAGKAILCTIHCIRPSLSSSRRVSIHFTFNISFVRSMMVSSNLFHWCCGQTRRRSTPQGKRSNIVAQPTAAARPQSDSDAQPPAPHSGSPSPPTPLPLSAASTHPAPSTGSSTAQLYSSAPRPDLWLPPCSWADLWPDPKVQSHRRCCARRGTR